MNTTTKIIFGIIFLIACVSGGYWFVQMNQVAPVTSAATVENAAQVTLDSQAGAAAQAIQLDQYATAGFSEPVGQAAVPAGATPPAPTVAPAASERKIS